MECRVLSLAVSDDISNKLEIINDCKVKHADTKLPPRNLLSNRRLWLDKVCLRGGGGGESLGAVHPLRATRVVILPNYVPTQNDIQRQQEEFQHQELYQHVQETGKTVNCSSNTGPCCKHGRVIYKSWCLESNSGGVEIVLVLARDKGTITS
uniref:Uncharacterized protein n=1 Tax=Timema poppense TaxID=170557 RepID=A0A7R9GV04_TIMPO|nr:unnamed protein product [Timema poppensis]